MILNLLIAISPHSRRGLPPVRLCITGVYHLPGGTNVSTGDAPELLCNLVCRAMTLEGGSATQLCEACSRRRARFRLGGLNRCLVCALRHPPLLRRSLATALVVGTVLTLINQGTTLFAGHFPAPLYWKIPLTYCVPFLVATWGALVNTSLPQAAQHPPG
jgi:hypothetical protein